ncbi:MAG: 7-cyano-7-deazaguanine synthase [Thaumarchaeota archaeon]|nr:7-cyano-7-deazaguanine synthase [Nitrososphaerota archaeon]
MKENTMTIVLLSGGIDSSTCLYLMREDSLIRALTFEYHGIARSEVAAARRIAKKAGVAEHRVVRLPNLKEASDIRGASFPGLPGTYIPMRNAIFYSFAAAYAEEARAQSIVGGHNRDDTKTFADAGRGFFDAFDRALWAGSAIMRREKTEILLPLANKTKAQVVREASKLGVPLELTWSCHRTGRSHCWKCDGCLARVWAFSAAGVADPLRQAK